MRKLLFLIAALCGMMNVKAQVALRGLYTPIYLQHDTTVVYMRDYLADEEFYDLSVPAGLRNVNRSEDTLHLVGTPESKLSQLNFRTKNGMEALTLVKSSLKKVTLRIPEEKLTGEEVRVIGDFNNWNRESAVIEAQDGYYTARYLLEPGKYQYKLFVDGEETMDPTSEVTVSNGMGGENNVLKIQHEQDRKPGNFGAEYLDQENAIRILEKEQLNDYLLYWNNQPINFDKGTGDELRFSIPEAAGEVKRSYIRVYSYVGDIQGKDMLIPLHYGKPVAGAEQLERLDWHQARLYFLMVDRFKNAQPENDRKTRDEGIQPIANYPGGDLVGVQQKLEEGYFDSLGVNTIWLSPITQNPLDAWGYWDKGEVTSKFSGYHGYWPISNVEVDFRFGTEQELRSLLQSAHERNNNMLLDYVANHVHINHPVYQNNPDWATNLYLPDSTKNTEKWDSHRLTTWFDDHLPTLDLRRYEIVDPLVDSALVWLTDYNFDGFRHDATKHIDELYWRTLTYRIRKNVDKPIYQIGETYGSPQLINSYISTGMLDAQFDFNLYDAAVTAFATSSGLDNLQSTLQSGLDTYGYHHLMGNISGNQDRARFISLASGDVKFEEDAKLAGWDREIGKPAGKAYQRLGLLHAFNNAIPGIPVIYYGDEYGLPGAGDPDNRRMMEFDGLDSDEQELRSEVKKLNRVRGSYLPLIYGSTQTEIQGNTFLIKRRYLDSEIMVILNTDPEESFTYTSADQWKIIAGSFSKTPEDDESIEYTIPPLEYIYLQKL